MKTYKKLHKPENYVLTEQDIADAAGFGSLLTHLTDIPASHPLHMIPITNAGIANQKVLIYIEDFENTKKFVPVLCDINLGVDLHHNRGIHMSRCVQAVFALANRRFPTLDAFAAELATLVREKQHSETGRVEVVGTYIHTKLTKNSAKPSLDRLYLISEATATEQEILITTGMKVYNITACPCTKTYTKFKIVPSLQSLGLTIEQINSVLDITLSGTHTQRGTTTLLVEKEAAPLSHKVLYSILEKSVHLVYELLKRPDEHELIIRALQKPQFTEDVAREVAYNTYQQLKGILSPQAHISIESILLDSIHIHDVRTVITSTFEDIKEKLV